jgi:hypothetical protein
MYRGNSVVRFPRSKKNYRHLVCDCGNFQSFSLNVVPVERQHGHGHELRRQAFCNAYGHRQTIGYGSIVLSD